jgi:iron complex transport system substrate-binding protein
MKLNRSLSRRSALLLGILAVTMVPVAPATGNTQRIVTLGGAVTEIVFALGVGENIVAVDSSSVFPAQVGGLPVVGYQRRLSAEGVLAMSPTLILASDEAGPPEAIAQLQSAGTKVVIIESGHSADAARRKIRAVAAELDRVEEGERVVEQLSADLTAAEKLTASTTSSPRVLFVYARGGGTVAVAGDKTEAAEMIRMAGATNAVTGFEGFKPLTAEAAVAAAPDTLLFLARGLESLGGKEAALSLPGLGQTPAGQNGRVVAMDDLYLLGFGPRLGKASADLTRLLHPELQPE